MKNNRTVLKALSAALLTCAVGIAAADTQNMNVTATVQGVCKFTSAVQTLSFGSVDPAGTLPIGGTGAAVSYKCTKGTTATGVAIGLGNNVSGTTRQMKNGANTDVIPYSLSVAGDTAVGAGFGSGVTASALTFTSQITPAGFANVSAGTYTDVVVLTLTP